MMTQQLSKVILDKISEVVPDARCELEYNTPYELLVAVVLSAQCTDIRVNQVTKKLFERARTPQQMMSLSDEELHQILYPLGFFKTKASSLKQLSRQLIDSFDGKVPDDREQLQSLKGVGRKTANVVLMECFNQPTIAVDTHVFRVSRRLGLSQAQTPSAVERDLYDNLPKSYHLKAHQTILHFGRYFCKSQRPRCDQCVVKKYCKFVQKD
jgi:endonuclease-3